MHSNKLHKNFVKAKFWLDTCHVDIIILHSLDHVQQLASPQKEFERESK